MSQIVPDPKNPDKVIVKPREGETGIISGYWYWKHWYDRIFRWKTVCFKDPNGKGMMSFRRNTWSYQTEWIKFEDRK